jgi:hypothetical protein
MVRLGFAVVALLLVYATLYWASLAIPKPLITYWASVKAIEFMPILNYQMLIIWLTSPFNAYVVLILNYPPWLYFIATVAMPTVLLALILVFVQRLCREGMADCVTVDRSFLTHSFALAIATTYITSLVTWLTLGKPGIGTSIYTMFTLTSAAYVTLYQIATLLRLPWPLRRLLPKLAKMLPPLLAVVAVGIAYSIFKFLPPTPPHLIGLVLTVIILTGYFIRHIGQARLIFWIIIIIFVIGFDIYLYIRYPKMVGPEVFTGILIAVVTIAPFTYSGWVAVPILRIEVPEIIKSKKPILTTVNPPSQCICSSIKQSITELSSEVHQLPIYQDMGYLRLRVRNTGLAAAEGCVFQVRIIMWPSNCPVNCYAPSDEYVDWQDVTWAGWKPSVLIRPNDVRYANIIMMPLQNASACLYAQWHCANQCNPIIAWVAKREVLMLGCTARPQDGLVAGEYVVDVQVTCRNGQKALKGLRLRISADWNTTDISQ